jgi:hypothetical protein
MKLTRCQDQKSMTLDEFYSRFITPQDHPISRDEKTAMLDLISRESGRTMLDLISRLRSLPDERRVFGLTSHEWLCLLAEDTSTSPWFVMINAFDKRDYSVRYLMPQAVAPWPGAYVLGQAQSEDEAVQMILIAMERSEGWSGR